MPPTPPRDFLGCLQSLGPLLAAFAAIAVGITQWHLQNQHLKQNRFERRFQIYRAADNFVSDTIHRSCKRDPGEYHTFQQAKDSAQFFFGADVLKVLEWIGDETGRLATESDVPVDSVDEQTESQRPRSRIARVAAFTHQWDNRKIVFWPYLQLHQNQPWYTRLCWKQRKRIAADSFR